MGEEMNEAIDYGTRPEDEMDAPYGTPVGDREVICMHCSDIYNESELVFEQRFGYSTPLWWCRNKDCDGAGIKHDIYPTDHQFVDQLVWKARNGCWPCEVYEPIEAFARHFADPKPRLSGKLSVAR
jgi:hypothetical protein